MTFFKYILSGLMLLLTGLAAAQVPASDVNRKNVLIASQAQREGEWLSYRDAYRSMLPFEKYGNAKNLLQNHFQISAKDKTATTEILQLSLVGKSTQLNLPLDATGRTVLPLLKIAYDENAELVLTQKGNQKLDQFLFRSRVSILVRPDGVYETADLREACEQTLAYQNYLDASVLRGKKCVGVRFSYPKKNVDAVLEFKPAGGNVQTLAMIAGAAFWGEANENFKTMTFLFSSWPEKGQLITRSAPIAISAQFD